MDSNQGFLSPKEANVAMRLAGEVHAGITKIPANIVALDNLIDEKVRNATLFFSRFGEVDAGMVEEITQLRLQKDALYGEWVIEKTLSMA